MSSLKSILFFLQRLHGTTTYIRRYTLTLTTLGIVTLLTHQVYLPRATTRKQMTFSHSSIFSYRRLNDLFAFDYCKCIKNKTKQNKTKQTNQNETKPKTKKQKNKKLNKTKQNKTKQKKKKPLFTIICILVL